MKLFFQQQQPINPKYIIRLLVVLVAGLALSTGYFYTRELNIKATLVEIRKVCPYRPE